MRMNVLHVIPGLHEPSSGTATFMQALLGHLCRFVTPQLAALSPIKISFSPEVFVKEFRWRTFPVFSLGRSPELYDYLKTETREVDIVHSHGLWMLPCIYPEFARRGTAAKLIVMPHGTLSQYALKRSWWKKRLMLLLGQKRTLRNADLLIATSQAEYQDFRNFGLRQPIAIIPIGIDLPAPIVVKKQKKLVFLSRLDQTKGIELLIRVWKTIANDHPDWKLEIAGPLNSEYAQKMVALAQSLQCERLQFVGELIGADKERFLSEASCFVLPTFSENFGIAIAEALACSTPVITTQGAPWKGLETHGAGWWIPSNDELALCTAMKEAMKSSSEALQQKGERGRAWMEREFSWERIASQYVEAYEWMLGQRPRPSFVHLN